MLQEKALHSLQELLGTGQVITDPAELIVYEIDAAQDRGTPEGVLFPHSAEEVSSIIRWANEHQVPVVARGAGTGLSGGAVADRGGIIVEFARMNQMLELDAVGRSAVVEPGLVNQTLDELVRTRGLYYPPDPASGRVATMGGNLAENAGGPHCFKYGVTTNYVTGLQFVTADGQMLRAGGRALDYPEYDFCGLLTGSEGTLGLITRVDVRLLRHPPGVKTLMASFDSVEQAGHAVSAVIAAGLVPSTMEMMDRKTVQIVEDYAHPGLPTHAGALLIIEVDGYPASLDMQIEEVAGIISQNGGRDLRIAKDAEQREKIWFARKSAAGAMARLAPAYLLLDGTVPRSRLAQALEASNSICAENGLRVGYVFHAGDGNLHPFILMYPDEPEQVERVHRAGQAFMQAVVELGGSITGEHGVGIEKRDFMPLMYTPAELEVMKDIKRVFDPQELLNPGKIFPQEEVQASSSIPTVERAAVPQGVFLPASTEEAARGLNALSWMRQPVIISGAEPDILESHRNSDTFICTRGLSGIQTYAGEDLYITAEAGTRLAELNDFLAGKGKLFPLASPWTEATLGGLIAANVNAPLRMRYGSLRDQVLAMTFVLADGRTIRAGRPVVKNVAGYDLPKVMVGSHGTLGLITEVTMKVTTQPRERRSLLVPVGDLVAGLEWGQQALSQALVASAVVLCKDIDINIESLMADSPYTLVYTAEGHPLDVATELDLVRHVLQTLGAPQPFETGTLSGTDCWARLLAQKSGEQLKLRTGVPPKDLRAFTLAQAAAFRSSALLIDLANGLIYTSNYPDGVGEAQAWVDELRKAALAARGYAVVLETPEPWQEKFNRWGYKPDTFELMKRLKARWDPAGILNPGVFGMGLS